MKNINIPNFKDLYKVLHDKMVDEVKEALAHQHAYEDINDAIINGLDDD